MVYEQLHAIMEQKGFSRTITATTGKIYHLPSAMYYKQGIYNINNVLDDAKRAARSVWNDVGAIAFAANSILWDGLRTIFRK